MQAETQTQPIYLEQLDRIIQETIIPSAIEIDRAGLFPRAALDALGAAGLLGLLSATEVGGLGQAHRAAAQVVGRIAEHCASTAMVVCMHYCATAVLEAYGPREVREAIAQGRHVSTLAFSESGSRSHFWAPTSTATEMDSSVQLDAEKSWVTSAGQADSYVWSSRPLAAEGASSIWFVPSESDGLHVTIPFDGLGMRGNASSPITAAGVKIGEAALLGEDGKGFDIMMGIVLPYFNVMNAAVSLGLADAAVQKAAAHLQHTRLKHLNQSLAESPVNRTHLAKARLKTDLLRTLHDDTLAALEQGRADAMLRVLEIKAAGGETAIEVTDLAMRVCGGAAFRKEVGVERCFRDARASTVMAPTADALYDFIGRALTGLPLFG